MSGVMPYQSFEIASTPICLEVLKTRFMAPSKNVFPRGSASRVRARIGVDRFFKTSFFKKMAQV